MMAMMAAAAGNGGGRIMAAEKKRVMYCTCYYDARLRDEPVDGDVQGRRERPSLLSARQERKFC